MMTKKVKDHRNINLLTDKEIKGVKRWQKVISFKVKAIRFLKTFRTSKEKFIHNPILINLIFNQRDPILNINRKCEIKYIITKIRFMNNV